MAMRDKKRREGLKNVDKREKVRLFTKKKRKVSQKDGKEDKRRGSERKILKP